MAGLADQATARLHPIEGVMQRLCLGRSKVFELLATGELRSVKVGRRRLVSEAALVEFIERLDEDQEAATRRDGDTGPPDRPRDPVGGTTSPIPGGSTTEPNPRRKPTSGDAA